jgi:hypothetical protein
MASPKRTTLARVMTILGAYQPPAMPWPAGFFPDARGSGNTSDPGGWKLKQSKQSLENFYLFTLSFYVKLMTIFSAGRLYQAGTLQGVD